MLGVLDWAPRELVVRTSRTKRSADFIALLEEVDRRYGRIASPEMFPNVDLLPHLKCSRPGWGRGDSDEAGEHGDAG
jgi:hypothetical protein